MSILIVGTFQTQYSEGSIKSGPRVIYASDTSANAYFIGGRTGGGLLIQENTKVSSSDTCQIFGTTSNYGATTKLTSAYSSGNYASAVNGVLSSSSSSGSLPTVTTFNIGSMGSSNQLNGWIGRVIYYNSRLPNLEIQRLSK